MKNIPNLILIFCLSAAPLFAERTIEMIESTEQIPAYEKGNKYIVSDKDCLVVVYPLENSIKHWRAAFALNVVNKKDSLINIKWDDVKVFSQDGQEIPIKKKQQVLDKEKSLQTWRDVGLAFCYGCSSFSAASAGNVSYCNSTQTYGPGYNYSSSFTQGQIHSPHLQQQAQRQATADYNNSKSTLDTAAAIKEMDIKDGYLDLNTVLPGQCYQSYFQFTIPALVEKTLENFCIHVTIDDQVHKFLVNCPLVQNSRPRPRRR